MAPSLAVREKIEARSLKTSNGVMQSDEFLPPLESGARLSRAEFERRYKAHPDIKKAELIEGVVYVPSPVRVKQHGLKTVRRINCLTVFVLGVAFSTQVLPHTTAYATASARTLCKALTTTKR